MRVTNSTLLLLGLLLPALAAGCGALRPLGTPSADDPASCTTPLVVSYADADGDGVGDAATAEETCGVPAGRVDVDGDCDDADGANFPGGREVCDTRDNDCDDDVDDRDDSLDPSSLLDWYMDNDGDGYGAGQPSRRCAADLAHPVADGTDCNDANPNVNPGVPEECGGGDEDCDKLVDDADPDVDPAGQRTWYTDGDGDGYGDPATAVATCDRGAAQVDNGDDCDDGKKLIGLPVDMWSDADLDGYGDGVSIGALCPPAAAGTVEAGGTTDCDDGNDDRFPGNPEVCGDGVDQDCVGADPKCKPIGSFDVHDGPSYLTNPPVYSCVDACAMLFGGVKSDYDCSTSDVVVDNLAYASGWGDASTCTNPVAETFSKEKAGSPGYNCGSVGCSYSAYVKDNCGGVGAVNYCWPH